MSSHPFALELAQRIRSGQRVFALSSLEELRSLEILEACAQSMDAQFRVFSTTQGLDGSGEPRSVPALLEVAVTSREAEFFVVLHGGAALLQIYEQRLVRDFAQQRSAAVLFFLDPSVADLSSIPEAIALRVPLPDRAELASCARRILDSSATETTDADVYAAMGVGMTRTDFCSILALAQNSGSSTDSVEQMERFARLKRERIDGPGFLTSLPAAPPDELGGLTQLKRWLARRALAFQPAARKLGISQPKGVLLVGVQGCGKSLAARACASILGLPLLRLDPARLYEGVVGASEANLRRMLEDAERVAPAVLWLDEIDKSLSGSESQSDAGTSARMLGTLLTWLSERSSPLFIAATANRVHALPPELLRRGRLDEIFFVDLPDEESRVEIIDVHLRKRPLRLLGEVPACADPFEKFAAVAASATGFSGAELEAALEEARLAAFERGESLCARDFASAVVAMIPLSTSHREQVKALRSWAKHAARSA